MLTGSSSLERTEMNAGMIKKDFLFIFNQQLELGISHSKLIKDMEDQDGDRRNKCETMPIVWGITATKLFISVWIVVLIGMLSVMFFYAFFNNWFIISIFILIFLIKITSVYTIIRQYS